MLYRGLTPTIIGVIPYAGTSFGIYETLKAHHASEERGGGAGVGRTEQSWAASGNRSLVGVTYKMQLPSKLVIEWYIIPKTCNLVATLF